MFKTSRLIKTEAVIMILLSLLKSPALPDPITPSGPGISFKGFGL